MKDFRKWFPALAVAALAFGAASTATAQQAAAFSCVGNAGVPPIVRAEGLTELVGDLVLNCTGGTPTASGQAVPQSNIQIFLNTNITSRLTSDPLSEALLMIDEPGVASQKICSTTNCGITGVGGLTGVNYNSADPNVKNIYQGRQQGPNSLVWLGVPIDPPGTSATRVIRITNVRAQANQLGTASSLIPNQIVMYVSVTGSTAVPLNNPQQTVAWIQSGLTFDAKNVTTSYLQCVSWNKDAADDNTKSLQSGGWGTILKYKEGFASSFKRRNEGVSADGTAAAPVVDQNVPGKNYNTETGFYSAALGEKIGLASNGTRLLARFANVPAGLTLFASITNISSDGSAIPGTLTAANTYGAGYKARLISTDSNGDGTYTTVAGVGSDGKAKISLSNGAGVAAWEVLESDHSATQEYYFAIAVSYAAATSSNLPGLGVATVAGSFAPLSVVTVAHASASIPRFADLSTAKTLFTLNPCTTNLLFVFLTNQQGFDSGIAISNTSQDPWKTTNQSGPCTLNYYGTSAGGGIAPAAQTSATIPAGKQLTAVLSTGGNYGIVATPGFQGYVIAQCQFQYAHGFAFISDVGANRVSEAYTALILDQNKDNGTTTRTGFYSEVLGH